MILQAIMEVGNGAQVQEQTLCHTFESLILLHKQNDLIRTANTSNDGYRN